MLKKSLIVIGAMFLFAPSIVTVQAIDGLLLNESFIDAGITADYNQFDFTSGTTFIDDVLTDPSFDFGDITLPEEPCTDEPCENPPLGEVIPTFSGLIVEGISLFKGEVAIDPDNDGNNNFHASDNGKIKINNNDESAEMILSNFLSSLYINVGTFLVDNSGLTVFTSPYIIVGTDTLEINSRGADSIDISIDGEIQSDGFGSTYVNTKYVSSSRSTSVSCEDGDMLVGCSGYSFDPGSSGGLKGANPNTLSGTCYAYDYSTSGGIRANAICLDPQGTRTGKYYK